MNIPESDTVEIRVPGKQEYVPIVRSFVTNFARRAALSRSAVEDVQVAISEACANVVRHAYVDRASQDMVVRCSAENGCLTVEVIDSGRGFDGHIGWKSGADRSIGFGILLMRNLMDQMYMNTLPDGGTVVRMVKVERRI